MTTRNDLIKAGTQALLRDGLDAMGDMGAKALAARVVGAVEPLIRADEQERETKKNAPAVVHLLLAADEHRTRLADLRAKVEALPVRQPSTGTVWVDRTDVLALIDEVRR